MRSTIVATAIALATLIATPAFAAPAAGDAPAKTQHAEGRKGGKSPVGDHEARHFPMPAADFKAKVDKRMTKARTRMEERAKGLSADEAKELRAKFEATAQNVNAELAKAIADGTVTKEEARAVRAAAPHRRHHKKS